MYHTNLTHRSYLSLLLSCRGKFSTGKVKNYSKLLGSKKTPKYAPKYTDHLANVVQKQDTFDQYLKKGREQAQKSVIVNVASEKSIDSLSAYCSKHAKIDSVYHYVLGKNNHFALLEFNSEQDAHNVMSQAVYKNKNIVIPTRANFLWFRNSVIDQDIHLTPERKQEIKMVMNSTTPPTERYVTDILKSAETVSSQIDLLYNLFKLNNIESKLRFCTAYQVEKNLQSLFPDLQVLPFGSSVNGFGKRGCDLDLVISLMGNNEDNTRKRLVYVVKTQTDEFVKMKNIMETMASTMQYLVPCIINVKRILNASVPIIKFEHTMTGLECDLSTTNMTAIYMTELMFLYGQIDWRVRPLVFVIRKWASVVKITNSCPGPWITNFPLTLMVIFFLQQKDILPSLKYLRDLAGKEDARVADNNVDCTFMRNISNLKKKQFNTDTLEKLLNDFFLFYSEFDFYTRAISLREGNAIVKPINTPLYICNPLETSKNVSKNVNNFELDRIRKGMISAHQLLNSSSLSYDHEWGLIKLLSVSAQLFKKTSSIDMKKIMNDDENLDDPNEPQKQNQMVEKLKPSMKQMKRRR